MILTSETASKFLTFLEEHETRLLSWGFYDVSFDAQEVQDLLDENAPDDVRKALEELSYENWTIETVLDEMANANLLYTIPGYEKSFRTRFAEGVRLIANLRQMFKESDWATGPRLVSDIKVQVNPRRYPVRDQSVSECWEDLKKAAWRKDLQLATLQTLSENRDGKEIEFANFQRLAFDRIFSKYSGKGLSGSIVTAGTGSGKTKAFYVPAFLGLVTEIEKTSKEFTKIIATYPRNVLLADQLREAISEALKLSGVIDRFGLRKITFGALLGTTPETHWFLKKNGKYEAEKRGWKRSGDGFIIPFLKSPIAPDYGLIWKDDDRLNGRTALYREGVPRNEPDVPDGILVITRENLKLNPPDVFFLSVEMLNREMGNPDWARTFGFEPASEKPRLFLLDEIHAYEGISGAQVSWVLRRWRHWSKARNMHFVGLSATLKDASNHLANVTGISPAAINEFTPKDSELTYQDAEYGIAIKGDPSSGSSLLSTTIQTAMLVGRLLTPRSTPRANDNEMSGAALFGRKVFGFTDNLDGLNRWFSDLSDAEGKRLARFRLPNNATTGNATTLAARHAAGQIWELPSLIGHNLSQPLNVTRCSSQDPGFNAGSDVVVASASLEVGFDDPEVGAMLHHKKPMSMSSFIQRKGRAGRRGGTRPWTIVVLSDYGVDRWAFQAAEKLFQPDIDRLLLPICNPHVLKIQAAYFLIDWLGQRINNGSSYGYLGSYNLQASRVAAREILLDFVKLGRHWKKFRADFVSIFGRPFGEKGRRLSDPEIDTILWQQPRPLLFHAVPSLLRRLETGWRKADPSGEGKYEDAGAGRPLPDFIPPATFSPLSGEGAELAFESNEDKDNEAMSISRALSETCPGRVSKRFSLKVREPGYWLSYSTKILEAEGNTTASVQSIFPDPLLLGTIGGIPVYQPLTFPLVHRPEEVNDTSNGFWDWNSDFVIKGQGSGLPINIRKPWRDLVISAESNLHRSNSSIHVTRFTSSCRTEIRLKKGLSSRTRLLLGSALGDNFSEEAVGFRIEADGIGLKLNKALLDAVRDVNPDRVSRFRPEYFLKCLLDCEVLTDRVNSFMIEWIWQTSLAMLNATALTQRCTLNEAQAKLKGKRSKAAARVLESIFQMRSSTGSDEEEESRLKQRIIEYWNDVTVLNQIEELEKLLWNDLGTEYDEWVQRRFVATIAQSFRSVASGWSAEIGDDDLIVDTFRESDSTSIFLTETSAGGLGQIELLADGIRRNPEAFADLMRHSISFCPRENLDSNILSILERAVGETGVGTIADANAAVRSASGYQQLATAKQKLQEALVSEGLDPSRDTIVALLSRVLRPGSSTRSDSFIYLLNRAWHKHEQKLGISIDPRTFSYVCVQYPPLFRRLQELFGSISGGEYPSQSQVYGLIQQFLFEGCIDSCPECLNPRNRYDGSPKPSRDLATAFLELDEPVIDIDTSSEKWSNLVRTKLVERGRIKLVFTSLRTAEAIKEIQLLLAEELEVGFILLPVAIVDVRRNNKGWAIILEVKGHGLDR